jgi:hypothetical protein
VLGVVCGVMLYRFRLNKERSIGPSLTHSIGVSEHPELMQGVAPLPSATSTRRWNTRSHVTLR